VTTHRDLDKALSNEPIRERIAEASANYEAACKVAHQANVERIIAEEECIIEVEKRLGLIRGVTVLVEQGTVKRRQGVLVRTSDYGWAIVRQTKKDGTPRTKTTTFYTWSVKETGQ
jgi:hypothetical protein